MYTKGQIETALKEFERLGSAQATITLLGYPSISTLTQGDGSLVLWNSRLTTLQLPRLLLLVSTGLHYHLSYIVCLQNQVLPQ